MEYYHLKHSGKSFPQASCINQSYAHLLKHNEFPNQAINLKYELNKGAEITDVLSEAAVTGTGLLLNKKALDLFLAFKVIDYKVYPAEVYDPKSGKSLEYFWLHLAGNEQHVSWIDFPKSGFYSTKAGFFKKYKNLKRFQDFLDFKKKKGILWGMETDSIILSDQFPNLDLFVFYRFTINLFISDLLKTALVEHKISGIQFEDAVAKHHRPQA